MIRQREVWYHTSAETVVLDYVPRHDATSAPELLGSIQNPGDPKRVIDAVMRMMRNKGFCVFDTHFAVLRQLADREQTFVTVIEQEFERYCHGQDKPRRFATLVRLYVNRKGFKCYRIGGHWLLEARGTVVARHRRLGVALASAFDNTPEALVEFFNMFDPSAGAHATWLLQEALRTRADLTLEFDTPRLEWVVRKKDNPTA